MFNMDDIKVFIDLTKDQIIQEFDALHKLASEFKGAEGEVFSIIITYVGFHVHDDQLYLRDILCNRVYSMQKQP